MVLAQESPNYVRLSKAADTSLGFSEGRFYRDAKLYCINLLLHYQGGCRANCLYCGQARDVAGSSECKTLIRVEWPLRKLDEVIEKIKRTLGGGGFLRRYRICVSAISNREAVEGEAEVVGRIYEALRIPVSVLISPSDFDGEEMKRLGELGAERAGIAIDCATRETFDLLRGKPARSIHSWESMLKGVEKAVEIFGSGKVGIHLIVGLGETEAEAAEIIQWSRDVGSETHLFSFYPESGSVLERWLRPHIGQYRRVQLARYLIDNGFVQRKDMAFNERGQVVSFGLDTRGVADIIDSGEPFMTSGCPGCNRPFANERPGEMIRNYPFPPTAKDLRAAKKQVWKHVPPRNSLRNLRRYLEKQHPGSCAEPSRSTDLHGR